MPDMTMCQEINCPRATRCWRFMAEPLARQSWFAVSPRVKDECEYFWRMKKEEKRDEEDAT